MGRFHYLKEPASAATKIRNVRSLSIGLLLACTSWAGSPIALTFNSLPSAQGWTYGGDIPETTAYSVSGGVLHQNGIGYLGISAGGYFLTGVVDPTLPSTLKITARVLQEQIFPGNHLGFFVGASDGTYEWGAGIGPSVIQFHNVLGQDYYFPFDSTQYHDYRFENTPGVGFKFFVDNNLLFSSALSPFVNAPNNLFLGDASQGAVAQADVTSFSFTQVVSSPTLSKNFGAATLAAGATTSLAFNLANPNTGVPLTNLSFSDILPAGLLVAAPNGLAGSCGGGTITAVAGSTTISLSAATLNAAASCTFSVSVTAPLLLSSLGPKHNVTSTLTSNEAPPAPAATADIFVSASPFLSSTWWYWYVLGG